jgi:hypothetical protein
MASISGDFSTGLKVHYKLEETSGNRTDEVSSIVLTDNNTVGYSASGIQGNCADFVSSNSEYLRNTSFSDFSRDTDISVSCWVNFDDFGSSTHSRGVFSLTAGDGTDSRHLTLRTYNNSGTILLRAYYNAGTGKVALVDLSNISTTFSAGELVHIGVSIDYGGYIRMYVNGSEVGTAVDISTFTYNSSGNKKLVIGAEADPAGAPYSGRYMNGLVDEVSIWETLLSASDFSTIYNSGSGIPYSAGATSSIKTVNTIAKASVKTLDGIAIASVKSIDTIT